jgi:hypothetical protein
MAKDMTISPIPSMTMDDIRLPNRRFRHVFLVQNRDFWNACPFPYDPSKDLVLTFDFAVVREVTAQGGTAAFLDHLVTSEFVEWFNHATYEYFATWYHDIQGNDIFLYQGLELGNSFRLDLWNDITYFVRSLINLLAVNLITCDRLFAGISDRFTLALLPKIPLSAERWHAGSRPNGSEYYFPIFQWMDEKVRPSGMKQHLKATIKLATENAITLAESCGVLKTADAHVFVQPYFPTAAIADLLKNDDRFTVVLEHFTWTSGFWKERRLPVSGFLSKYREPAEKMIADFKGRFAATWNVDGIEVGDMLRDVIIDRIQSVLPRCLRIADSVIRYFSDRSLKLMIFVTNTGLMNSITLDYCRKEKIPSYFVLNGLLLHYFPEEETKHVTWINCYGESIKKDYFKDASNVVCLGDPRIDWYVELGLQKKPNRSMPTIIIGAAGFSNIDLGSYVAFEFDFLYDILDSLRVLRSRGRAMRIIVKVRTNGYIDQYRRFVKEYFSDLPIDLQDTISFRTLIQQADLYLSSYSGTFFEASSLGIPVLYYKSDTELLIAPYDGRSELVTARTPAELMEKIDLFYDADPIFDAFKDKKVLEKYVGPLDGRSLERNIDFIYSLLNVTPLKKEALPS